MDENELTRIEMSKQFDFHRELIRDSFSCFVNALCNGNPESLTVSIGDTVIDKTNKSVTIKTLERPEGIPVSDSE